MFSMESPKENRKLRLFQCIHGQCCILRNTNVKGVIEKKGPVGKLSNRQ